jgi:hypothetical protein
VNPRDQHFADALRVASFTARMNPGWANTATIIPLGCSYVAGFAVATESLPGVVDKSTIIPLDCSVATDETDSHG